MIVDGLTLVEFEAMARKITAMDSPYDKWLLTDEKTGMGSFNQRSPVKTGECPEHMKLVNH